MRATRRCVQGTQECVRGTRECVRRSHERHPWTLACVRRTQECVRGTRECVRPSHERHPWTLACVRRTHEYDPGVGIYDLNNNFNCYRAYNYDYVSCNATNTTVWTNTACTNHVHAWGLLYKIEYTNDPYHDNYLGFELDVDNCAAFY